MIQRLLLNRIDLQRSRMRIPQAVKLPALVRPYVAEPSLPFPNMAMPRTKIAMHFPAGFRLPPARLMQHLGFLQDFEFGHRGVNSERHYTPVGWLRSSDR